MPQESTDHKKIQNVKEKILKEYPFLNNLNGIEIRNPISMELHGNLGIHEDLALPQYQHKIPVPQSFLDYIEKNRNLKLFDHLGK